MGKRRRRWLAAVLLGTVLIAGYGAYWLYAARVAEDGLDAWLAARRAEGWRAEYAEIAVGGFPFAVTVRLVAPRLAGPGDAWSWQGDSLAASARPWSLGRVHASLPATSTLAANGRAVSVTLAAGGADLAFAGGRLADWRVRLRTASVRRGENDGLAIEALDAAGDGAGGITLAATGVVLPKAPNDALGRDIQDLALSARGLGTLPPGPPAQALAAWRDAGGTVEVERLALTWGPATLDADGTLTLDAAFRPLAAFSARLTGWGAVIEGLVESGTLAPGNAALTKTLLDLMARPDGTGRRVLEVPVTAQDGRLVVGPATLLHFGPLPIG